MALAGIRQAVDRAVYAAVRPGRAEGIVSPELAAEGFKKKLWPGSGRGQVFTFDIDIFPESPASDIRCGRLQTSTTGLSWPGIFFPCLVA
jgi:hypothetical protein